jgi:hypothetical protein
MQLASARALASLATTFTQEIHRMRRILLAATMAVAACAGFLGCNSGTPKVETYDVAAPDPLAEAKSTLTNYSNGMPLTSEVESFPDLIKRVKEKDAAKGDILEKGLNEIKANPASAKTKATELLKQL